MNERKPKRKPDAKAAPFDPIALSLALWLGLMVGALGLQHMAEDAAAQQAAQQSAAQRDALVRPRPGHPAPAHVVPPWEH